MDLAAASCASDAPRQRFSSFRQWKGFAGVDAGACSLRGAAQGVLGIDANMAFQTPLFQCQHWKWQILNLREVCLILHAYICLIVYSQDSTWAYLLWKLIALLEDPANLRYIYLCLKRIFCWGERNPEQCQILLEVYCSSLSLPLSPCRNCSGNWKYFMRLRHTNVIEGRQHLTEL